MTPPVVIGAQVGRVNQRMACPACHAQIATMTEGVITTKTHIVALILCIFGCWPCVLIPYCSKCCKNINHYCPNCKALVGTYVY